MKSERKNLPILSLPSSRPLPFARGAGSVGECSSNGHGPMDAHGDAPRRRRRSRVLSSLPYPGKIHIVDSPDSSKPATPSTRKQSSGANDGTHDVTPLLLRGNMAVVTAGRSVGWLVVRACLPARLASASCGSQLGSPRQVATSPACPSSNRRFLPVVLARFGDPPLGARFFNAALTGP